MSELQETAEEDKIRRRDLERIIPYELFDNDGVFNSLGYYQELRDAYAKGYPNNDVTTTDMIKAYAQALKDKDSAKQQLNEGIRRYARSVRGGFPVPDLNVAENRYPTVHMKIQQGAFNKDRNTYSIIH